MTASTYTTSRAVQCDGKAVFDTWSRAAHRIKLWRLTGRRYDPSAGVVPSPYRCPHCGRYHIGNLTKRQRRQSSSAPLNEWEG